VQTFAVDALENGNVEPGKQRHAAHEALAEVDLAAHRRRGDRGHLRFDALHVSDLVDALDGDERPSPCPSTPDAPVPSRWPAGTKAKSEMLLGAKAAVLDHLPAPSRRNAWVPPPGRPAMRDAPVRRASSLSAGVGTSGAWITSEKITGSDAEALTLYVPLWRSDFVGTEAPDVPGHECAACGAGRGNIDIAVRSSLPVRRGVPY
jgi:hypothetical protein